MYLVIISIIDVLQGRDTLVMVSVLRQYQWWEGLNSGQYQGKFYIKPKRDLYLKTV